MITAFTIITSVQRMLGSWILGQSMVSPSSLVSVGWGLGSLTNAWGYGAAYYNPYYLPPVGVTSVPYNYSQPVVINNYIPVETASSVVGNQAVSDAATVPRNLHKRSRLSTKFGAV